MKIPGYSHWLTVFRPLRWLVPLAEQAYDVAGIFLAADTPLPDETVRLLQRMVGELGAIRDLLERNAVIGRMPPPPGAYVTHTVLAKGHLSDGRYVVDQASAPPVAHSRSPEDAGEGPPPIAPDTVSGGGHPKTEDPFRHVAELARLQRELDAARQERDNANARANAGRLAP